MALKVYTVKSNARRDAKKQGLSPDDVIAVPGGFIIGAPASPAVAPAEDQPASPSPVPEPSTVVPAPEPVEGPKHTRARTLRADGKGARLLARLRADWTPATEIAAEYGWQAHTLRGAISTLAKKHAVTVERRKVEGVTSYRVAP